MAVTVVATTGQYASSSTNSISLAVPSGAGDIYVIAISNASSSAITWPSGFTELPTAATDGTVGVYLRVAIRTRTGTESGSFTGSKGAWSTHYAMCALVSGVSTSLITSSTKGSYPGYVSTVTLAGNPVTLDAANRAILWFGVGYSSGTPTFTVPAALTHAALYNPNTGNAIELATGIDSNAGSQTYSGSVAYGTSNTRVALTATLVFAQSGGGSIAGAFSLAETAGSTATITRVRQVSLALSGTDALAAAGSRTRPISTTSTEAGTTSTVGDRTRSVQSSIAEATSLSGTSARLRAVSATVAEGETVSTTISRVRSLAASIATSENIAETATRARAVQLGITEASGFSMTSGGSMLSVGFALSQSAGASFTVQRTRAITAAVQELGGSSVSIQRVRSIGASSDQTSSTEAAIQRTLLITATIAQNEGSSLQTTKQRLVSAVMNEFSSLNAAVNLITERTSSTLVVQAQWTELVTSGTASSFVTKTSTFELDLIPVAVLDRPADQAIPVSLPAEQVESAFVSQGQTVLIALS